MDHFVSAVVDVFRQGLNHDIKHSGFNVDVCKLAFSQDRYELVKLLVLDLLEDVVLHCQERVVLISFHFERIQSTLLFLLPETRR